MTNLFNLFQEIKVEGVLLNSFCEASIILITKPNKHKVVKNCTILEHDVDNGGGFACIKAGSTWVFCVLSSLL